MAESQRVKLEITEVEEEIQKGPRKDGKGEWQKLSFKARVDDKELPFFTFSSRLFETIVKGKTIEADVAISTREYDGNTYIDRKVTQIYVEGQPVGGQKQWQGRQDSPEKIASIENQKRADIIAQLFMADKLKDSSSQVKKLLKWLDKLDASPNPAPADIKQAEKDAKELWPDKEEVPPSEPPVDVVDQTVKQDEEVSPTKERPEFGVSLDMEAIRKDVTEIWGTEGKFKTWLAQQKDFKGISMVGSLTIILGKFNDRQREVLKRALRDMREAKGL